MTATVAFVGADTKRVDPYWDFEHTPGRPYETSVARPWRTRVVATNDPWLELQLRRTEPDAASIDVAQHVGRLAPGRDGERWVPLGQSAVRIEGSTAILAIDLTALDPGSYELALHFPDSPAFDTTSELTVIRRPHYTFDDEVPRARSSTGLVERVGPRGPQLLTAHGWPVVEHRWSEGAYRPHPRRVVAVTQFDPRHVVPLETRILLRDPGGDDLAGWQPDTFAAWDPPSIHQTRPTTPRRARLGLPFPRLVGLPRQPSAEGDFEGPPLVP